MKIRITAGPLAGLLILGLGIPASAAVVPFTAAKEFLPSTIPVNGTTTLNIVLNNENGTTDITGIGFSDTLPAGLTIVSPTVPGTFPGCFNTGTLTITTGSIVVAGTKVVASGACIIFVELKATTAGTITNTTSAFTTDQMSLPAATAQLNVDLSPTLTKTFGELAIPVGGSTSLTFALTNPNANPLTGLKFTDTLPVGLEVATPNGFTGGCGSGAVFTATPGSGTITLSDGTVGPVGTCTFAVNVTGTAVGTQNNVTSTVTSNEGVTGSPATASIYVGATNVTSQVIIGVDPFQPDRNSRDPNWCTVITLMNPSTPPDRTTRATTIAGPIEVVLTNISSNATFENPSGMLGGNPYVIAQPSDLPPGGQASAPLCFLNPTGAPITFVPRVYSGALP